MKKLHLLDKNRKILFLSVFVVVLTMLISIYLIDRKDFDLQISIIISEDDQTILEQRLKAIRINSYRISRLNNDEVILSLKKSSFDKNDLDYEDIGDILLMNHTYEVFLVDREFYKEISKLIQSDYTYPINFKSAFPKPIITGVDIEQVKNKISQNNLNEDVPITIIKYTEYGKSKNEYISKLNEKKNILISLLDNQFWSFGWVYPYSDLNYFIQPNSDMIRQFKMIGKNYTYTDIKNIALFSKYSYKNPVKLIEIKDLEKESEIK